MWEVVVSKSHGNMDITKEWSSNIAKKWTFSYCYKVSYHETFSGRITLYMGLKLQYNKPNIFFFKIGISKIGLESDIIHIDIKMFCIRK